VKLQRAAEALLDAGVNVCAQASSRITPLHSASEQGHVSTVTLLLSKGAEVDARTLRTYLTAPTVAPARPRASVSAFSLPRSGVDRPAGSVSPLRQAPRAPSRPGCSSRGRSPGVQPPARGPGLPWTPGTIAKVERNSNRRHFSPPGRGPTPKAVRRGAEGVSLDEDTYKCHLAAKHLFSRRCGCCDFSWRPLRWKTPDGLSGWSSSSLRADR